MDESSATGPWSWLMGPPRHRSGARVFQLFIGIALLFRSATEGPFAAWLWGPLGIGQGGAESFLGAAAPAINWIYRYDAGVYALVAVQALGALLLIAGRGAKLGCLLCLVALTVLEWRTTEINDGGDNLARLSLLYMLLLAPHHADVPARSLRAYFHNLGIVLLIAQVLVLYFTAGMAKASGEVWNNGTALYLISHVEAFSLPGLRRMFENPFITVGASYATVVWQVLFPIGIFSRWKLWFLFIGMFFHLGIAVFMGLVSFSMIMAGAELLLLTDDDYEAFWSHMPFRRKSA